MDLAFVLFALAAPLLLLVLRPWLPALHRNYHLWKNRVEARAGDFVDWFCIDRAGRVERRRALASRELVYGAQLARLDQLNDQVARVARNASEAFSEHRYDLAGKYDFLEPTPFAGRVAAIRPEEGPVPKLSLWTRLRRRVDWDVFWADQKILRITRAMEENQARISDLEHQLKFRSEEHRAIEDQVRICRERRQEAW